MSKKISELTSASSLGNSDAVPVVQSGETKKFTLSTLKTFFQSIFQDKLTSGTNIKTINNQSILGSGNISVGGTGTPSWGSITGTLSSQTDLNNALNGKQATLTSGTNIKTINNQSILGSGNINISGGGGDSNVFVFSKIDVIYGDVTYQDISDAIASGKVPMMTYGDSTFVCRGRNGTEGAYRFYSPDYIEDSDLFIDEYYVNFDNEIERFYHYGDISEHTNTIHQVIYGSTTYSKISSWYNAGETMVVLYNGDIYTGKAKVGNIFFFHNASTFYGDIIYKVVSVNPSNQWNNYDEVVIEREISVSSSSTHTQYPTSKAVYDYVQDVVGDIDSALQSML